MLTCLPTVQSIVLHWFEGARTSSNWLIRLMLAWMWKSSVSPRLPSLAGSWLVETAWVFIWLHLYCVCECVFYLHVCLKDQGGGYQSSRPSAGRCSSLCFSGNCESEDRLSVWPTCAHLTHRAYWTLPCITAMHRRACICGMLICICRIWNWIFTTWSIWASGFLSRFLRIFPQVFQLKQKQQIPWFTRT